MVLDQALSRGTHIFEVAEIDYTCVCGVKSILYLIMYKPLLLLLVIGLTVCAHYKRYLHNLSTGARCLDGSPSAIYVSEGEAKANILIFFMGGGYCQGDNLTTTLEDCYKRSKTDFGSSSAYSPTLDLDVNGILSSNPTINPNFWNWTRVYIPYCDGSIHQGSRLNPISFKDRELYFRGANNTLQNLAFLNKTFNLYSADKIVVTGISAGGMATFMWSNYIYDQSTNKQVFTMPDSGLFLDYPSPITNQSYIRATFATLFKLVNNETRMPISECVQELGNSLECFFFGEIVKYFKTPLFIIESQYDAFSIAWMLDLKCIGNGDKNGAFSLQNCNDTEKGYINDHREGVLVALKNFTYGHKKVGIWAPSCVQHGFTHVPEAFNGDSYRIPNSAGMTISSSIATFLSNPDSLVNIHIDTVTWPDNKGCSGTNNQSILLTN